MSLPGTNWRPTLRHSSKEQVEGSGTEQEDGTLIYSPGRRPVLEHYGSQSGRLVGLKVLMVMEPPRWKYSVQPLCSSLLLPTSPFPHPIFIFNLFLPSPQLPHTSLADSAIFSPRDLSNPPESDLGFLFPFFRPKPRSIVALPLVRDNF